ncbi:MAG: hypothetical protein JRG69_03485 [Deltaproteobacteria bacterium]|nr:hypothetical protein [Deltaproteobacteria bacterium]
MFIDDPRYKDAHMLDQGDFRIAVNECCAVIGNGPERRISISFLSYRWDVLDEVKSKMHAELLKERLNGFERNRLDFKVLVDIATVCMDHYKLGEEQGWLREIKPYWEHDCKDCIFLGPMVEGGSVAEKNDQTLEEIPVWPRLDLYYCPNKAPFPTVIVRHGNEGHEYKSGILFGMFDLDDDLHEAYQRATLMGLLSGIKLPRINALDMGRGIKKNVIPSVNISRVRDDQ